MYAALVDATPGDDADDAEVTGVEVELASLAEIGCSTRGDSHIVPKLKDTGASCRIEGHGKVGDDEGICAGVVDAEHASIQLHSQLNLASGRILRGAEW